MTCASQTSQLDALCCDADMKRTRGSHLRKCKVVENKRFEWCDGGVNVFTDISTDIDLDSRHERPKNEFFIHEFVKTTKLHPMEPTPIENLRRK